MNDLSSIKTLNDNELLSTTLSLVAQERQVTADILHYLAEIESRRLYAQRGYSSLWEFATKELRYSSGAAYRRIDAMRFTKSLNPEDRKDTLAALNEGRLHLSAVNAVTQFLKDEKRENGKIYGAVEKKKILEQVEGKSKPECLRILATINPANHEKAKRHVDQTRALSADRTEVCFAMGAELARNLEKIKNLWAHHFKTPPTYEELLLKMSQLVLERIDPLKGASRKSKKISMDSEISETPDEHKTVATIKITADKHCTPPNVATVNGSRSSLTTSTAKVESYQTSDHAAKLGSVAHGNFNSRSRPYISVKLKRSIWQRDQGQCSYVDKNTGRRCDSKHRLQIEHDRPFCLGGAETLENLSLKCQTHNALLAFEKLGSGYMARFMSDMAF